MFYQFKFLIDEISISEYFVLYGMQNKKRSYF